MHDENLVTYFAETDSRNKRVPFGIKRKDRSRHMYVIGKTGMGKSTLLENMAVQDIKNGEGIAFVDPHGKSADLLLEYVPESRIKDVLYFAPFDMDYPISFNVMEDVGPDKRHLVANGLMSAFKKIWVDAWSARMEYILNNILLALLEYPDSTLIGVNRMLADKDYRKKVVDNITDPSVKSFWIDEFAKYGDRYMQEAGAAIQNKIGQFVSNPLVRNIIGQPKSTFDIRTLMDERKIMIINLSKGRVGESNANLLGSMLITKIYLAAMSRADLQDEEMKTRPHFYLYVDEFQNFANESFADILSEARKYKLDLTVAHQYIEQMSEEVRPAVFGNVGTMITFRVGAYDAEFLEKEFSPTFLAEDLVNLGLYQFYIKLMIDGVSSPPFSATTLPPIKKDAITFMNAIIESSRKTYAQTRTHVEEEIKNWHMPIKPDAPSGAQSSQGQGGERRFPPRENRDGPRSFERASSPAPTPARAPERSMPRSPQPPAPEPVQNHNTHHQPVPERRSDFHPKSAVTSTTTPEPSKQQAVERQNKETELRKAMSLDYLKPKPEPVMTKKTPSPQNIADLRSALLGVLKDNQPKKEDPAPAQPSAPAPSPVSTPPSATVKPTENPAGPKEVPEEVLRKLLHVDPEQTNDIK